MNMSQSIHQRPITISQHVHVNINTGSKPNDIPYMNTPGYFNLMYIMSAVKGIIQELFKNIQKAEPKSVLRIYLHINLKIKIKI